jgi:hypothetical protein
MTKCQKGWPKQFHFTYPNTWQSLNLRVMTLGSDQELKIKAALPCPLIFICDLFAFLFFYVMHFMCKSATQDIYKHTFAREFQRNGFYIYDFSAISTNVLYKITCLKVSNGCKMFGSVDFGITIT